MVLTDSFYPGWKATVDGKPASIERVDYVLRGVSIGPGHHTIVMRYQPASWRIGWIVSLVALLGLLGALASRLDRDPPAAPRSDDRRRRERHWLHAPVDVGAHPARACRARRATGGRRPRALGHQSRHRASVDARRLPRRLRARRSALSLSLQPPQVHLADRAGGRGSGGAGARRPTCPGQGARDRQRAVALPPAAARGGRQVRAGRGRAEPRRARPRRPRPVRSDRGDLDARARGLG